MLNKQNLIDVLAAKLNVAKKCNSLDVRLSTNEVKTLIKILSEEHNVAIASDEKAAVHEPSIVESISDKYTNIIRDLGNFK